MFISLSLLLASSVAFAHGDSTKKKAPEAPSKNVKVTPAKPRRVASTAPATLAGAPSPAAPRQSLLGRAIEKSVVSTARSVAPRATFLSAAIRRHMSAGGPALPSNIRADPNAVPFTADSIVVEKSRRTMTLYSNGSPVRIYFIALGRNPVGKKIGIGDNRTPEGVYYIDGHNPESKYHLSLRVSYPNEQDLAEAGARGIAAGGDIMIHGLPRGFEKVGAEHRQRDWTNGCIAVTNAEIEEIWSAIPDGAVIYIKP